MSQQRPGWVVAALGPTGFMPRVASVPAGQVTVGSDDRISEIGKVGEVQPVCPTSLPVRHGPDAHRQLTGGPSNA